MQMKFVVVFFEEDLKQEVRLVFFGYFDVFVVKCDINGY